MKPFFDFDYNTSLTGSRRNTDDFFLVCNLILSHMIKWFAANNLVLKWDKQNKLNEIHKI